MMPYYSRCQFCGVTYAVQTDHCTICDTDDGMYDIPFEEKEL